MEEIDTRDESLSSDNTRSLFWGLSCFAMLVPTLAMVFAWLYASYMEISFSKHQIKEMVFATWGITLAGLLLFGFFNRRGAGRRRSDPSDIMHASAAELTATKWEQRKATRLFVRSYLVSLMLPWAGIALALIPLVAMHTPFGHREAVLVLQIYGISAAVLVVRAAIRSRGERMVYLSTPEGLKS
ncbi:MAG: hypothetical protein U0136_10135 [Bdellovibrionota bacterium]